MPVEVSDQELSEWYETGIQLTKECGHVSIMFLEELNVH